MVFYVLCFYVKRDVKSKKFNNFREMKKFHINSCLVALLMYMLTGITVEASNSRIAKFDNTASAILTSGNHIWKSAETFKRPKQSQIVPSSKTLGPTEDYSLLEGPDGTQWYATQTFKVSNYYYTESEITLYDNKGEVQSTLPVVVPSEGSCNQIIVGNIITSKLFDLKQNTYEIPVTLHIIHSPGVTSYITYIYDLATGKVIFTYNGFMTIVQTYTGYGFEPVAILSYTDTEENVTVQKYDIYTKATYSSNGAFLKKSFSIPTKLAEYQVGSPFNVFTVGNELYYVVSQYEKEYLDPASYEEPWDMIPTENNNFTATIYNKNFAEVGKVSIPITSTSQYLVQYGVGLYGSEELTNDFWDESGELRLVLAVTGFEVNTGDETISFKVYDMDGNAVKTIAEDVSNWMNMYDIYGQSKQMAFLSSDGQTLSMIDVPSCETVVSFGIEVEGNAISTNIDRYPVGGSYQYVIALAAPEYAENGDVFQRFAWVTKEGKIDHIVKFNVGPNNASWTPLVMGEVLNPYLFDTDSQREYVFIANQRESSSSAEVIDELRIVKEDGTIVGQYIEDPAGKGDLGTCALLGLNGDTPTLLIPYLSSVTDKITVDLEFLPLAMFCAGGVGTKDNPYCIASAGDLAMIAHNPSAHYKVVNDFDAADFGAWKAIPTFTGSLDGGNNTISNLILNGNDIYSAIFASSEAATIKNIILESPTVDIEEGAESVAFLVAEALSDTISNIRVKNAVITGGESTAAFGGIAAYATFNTEISECFVENISINAPNTENVGGIAGNTLTGSTVKACAVTGNIIAGSNVGGIVGSTSTDCKVVDCHADVNIEGYNTIGGIVGAAERGGIHTCYVEGSLIATKADRSGNYKTGGVAGSLSSDWSTTEESVVDPVISGNVVALESITAGEGGAVHRIVGYTRLDEDKEAMQWDPSLVPVREVALADNYVVSTLAVIDNAIAAEATTTEGADVAETDMNKAFFEACGFKYGTDAENPWCEISANALCLYFENEIGSSVESVEEKTAKVRYDGNRIMAEGAVLLEIYSVSGLKLTESASSAIETVNLESGIYIVLATYENGEKSSFKVAVK